MYILNKKNFSYISVLYLIDQIWNGRGGTEQHLNWLLQKLPGDTIKKHFVIFSRQIDADSTDNFPIKPLILGDIYGNSKATIFRRFIKLVQYIRKNEIDVIHALTIRDELFAVIACWMARTGRVCAHRRNIGYSLNLSKKLMSRFAQLFKIGYIANSKAAKSAAFKNERIDADRVTVIHNPVDLERAQEGFDNQIPRSEIPAPLDCPLIGMVASVRRVKGYEVFIESAHYVLEKFPDAFFICVGEQDSYLQMMKDLVKKFNIESRILWFGRIDNAFRILPHFTVAVLSSHSESFSNAVLEYAIAGKAIVASDVGGMREIIADRESGFLVPPNQPELLADRIIELLDNPNMRKQFGCKARDYALHNFSEKKIMMEYIDFYSIVCSE